MLNLEDFNEETQTYTKDYISIPELANIIEINSTDKTPVDPRVTERIYEIGDVISIIYWIGEFKNERCLVGEKVLADIILKDVELKSKEGKEDNDSDEFDIANCNPVISYFNRFKDIKDGPLWDVVVNNPSLSFGYATLIKGERFIEGEVAILKSPLRKPYMMFIKPEDN